MGFTTEDRYFVFEPDPLTGWTSKFLALGTPWSAMSAAAEIMSVDNGYSAQNFTNKYQFDTLKGQRTDYRKSPFGQCNQGFDPDTIGLGQIASVGEYADVWGPEA